ncbi:MAG TPA: MATE family efflux transporter [Stellaceae bacterium]
MSPYPSALRAELRAMLPIALPLAAANLAQMAMGLTNAIMVGHLGGAALSAAGLGGALYFTVTITTQGVLTAVAPLAARAIGARDHRAAGQIAAAGLLLAAAAAVPIVALLSVIDRLLLMIGYDPVLAAEIGRYLAAIRWAAPAFLAFGVLRALLAAAFRARTVMIVLVLGIPANAALNWVMIFGHLGMPALGIAGSGWATAIIQSLMALGLGALLLLMPLHTPIRVSRRVMGQIGQILRLGLPIGGLIALEAGVFMTTGILAGLLGADALGAHQLVINFASLSFMVPLGIGQAATVRVGFELGAGAPATARRAAFVALGLGASFMGATAILIWTFPLAIADLCLDLDDPANKGLVAIALRLLWVAALFQIVDGVQAIAAGALRGYRDTAVPMAIAALGYWGIGFAGGWALAFPFGLGAVGLWWGLALGLAIVAVLLTVRLHLCAGSAVRGDTAGIRVIPQA